MKEYQCPATLDNLRPVLALAAEEMIACDTETNIRQRLFVVLEELFNNVALHAYAEQANPGPVRIRLFADIDMVKLEVADQGTPFNLLEYDDSRRVRNLEALEEGGGGIFLVKVLASEVEYHYEEGWNLVTITIIPQG